GHDECGAEVATAMSVAAKRCDRAAGEYFWDWRRADPAGWQDRREAAIGLRSRHPDFNLITAGSVLTNACKCNPPALRRRGEPRTWSPCRERRQGANSRDACSRRGGAAGQPSPRRPRHQQRGTRMTALAKWRTPVRSRDDIEKKLREAIIEHLAKTGAMNDAD